MGSEMCIRDRTYSAEITHLSYRRMTTSRIYAYRWPARLVSHKPFAAERYSITSSCIWQVFFRKNADFLFLFALFHLPGDFLCRMHNWVAVFSVENPAQGIECPFSGRFILKTSPSGGDKRRAGSATCFSLFEESRHADAQRLKSGYFFAFAFSSSRSFSLGVTYTVVYTS